jgi:glycosyltransferase involved in cell wall biosynthesis
MVSYLTEELVAQGHDVTLFASGDSRTTARLVSTYPRALRLDKQAKDHLAHHYVMLEAVIRQAEQFDIIHYHIDYVHFPVSRRLARPPQLTTMHGRLDLPDLHWLYREYSDMPLVSISNAQREPIPHADWRGTVYPGLPVGLHSLHEEPGAYLAFLGRISPEKRLDRAIEIARRVGMPLRIAAKVDRADRSYFEKEIKPLLEQPLVEFLGEIGEAEKERFLGEAYALLFPNDWREPFGLAMIEALSCGTPVVAWRQGSVSEVLEDGVTGFIVEELEDAVAAVEKVAALSRRRCREGFEECFSARRMARDYLSLYRRLLGAPRRRVNPHSPKRRRGTSRATQAPRAPGSRGSPRARFRSTGATTSSAPS